MNRTFLSVPGWVPVASVFAANGALMASWAPHIPYIRAQLDLSPGRLGVALLGMSIGALLAMFFGGWVASRVGSRVVTRVTSVGLAIAVPLPVIAPSYGTLFASLLFVGSMTGTMDVAMNALGARVEARSQRKVMSSLHGMFSVGALIGSGAAAASLALDVAPRTHIVAAAVLTAALVLPALVRLPGTEEAAAVAEDPGAAIVLPRGAVLWIGMLALLALAAEGAVFDWGSTLLRDDFGARAAVAALAYGVFNAAMATTRFMGDGLREKWGNVVILRIGGTLSAVGLAAGLLSGNAWVALAGFALMGLGLGNAVPVLFVAAAERGATPELGIAGAATFGYFGFLVGPPSFGGVAELIGLPASLGIAVAMCAVLALGAGLARPSASRERAGAESAS